MLESCVKIAYINPFTLLLSHLLPIKLFHIMVKASIKSKHLKLLDIPIYSCENCEFDKH